MIRKLLIAVITVILLISCSEKPKETEQVNASIPKQEKKEEQKAVSVVVEVLKPKNLENYISVTGKLEGETDITMTSETSGKVLKLYKNLGDWVEKGDELGYVDNEDYRIALEQAKVSLEAAQATLEMSNITFEAAQKLYDSGQISKVEFIQYQSENKGAEAGVKGAKVSVESAQKAYNNTRLVAPATGYIAEMFIEEGEVLGPSAPICTIVNTKNLIVKTGVGEIDITKISKGQKVRVTHPSTDEVFSGKITGIGIKPKQGFTSYPVEITIDNKDGKLFAGMVVTANILSKIYENVIYTSFNNLVEEYDKYYVFIIENNLAKRKEVKFDIKVGEMVIFNNGLNPSEKLVVSGKENLEEGSLVAIRKTIE